MLIGLIIELPFIALAIVFALFSITYAIDQLREEINENSGYKKPAEEGISNLEKILIGFLETKNE